MQDWPLALLRREDRMALLLLHLQNFLLIKALLERLHVLSFFCFYEVEAQK